MAFNVKTVYEKDGEVNITKLLIDGVNVREIISSSSSSSSLSSINSLIASGFGFSAILLNEGEVMTCGRNDKGQLGDNSNTSRNTLDSMNIIGNYTGSNAVAVNCGGDHTVVLLNTGEVMACGGNDRGQLGDSGWGIRTMLNSMHITGNYTGSNAVAVSCGGEHTVVLLNTGEVMACGYNDYGQLGKSGPHANILVSMSKKGDPGIEGLSYTGSNAVAISCGGTHTAILLDTGEVMTCGLNNYGQLGDSSNANKFTLVSMQITGNYTGSNAVALVVAAIILLFY